MVVNVLGGIGRTRGGPVMLRVLLVDEDANALRTLAPRFSRMEGIALAGAAGNMLEVEERLRSEEPDLVLLDIHRRDGRDTALCHDIRRVTGAPLIVLASYMTAGRWADMRAAGATAFVLKHINTGRLGRELLRLSQEHGASRKEQQP